MVVVEKKTNIGYCNSGCEGLQIPLNDSILAISDDIKTWFDLESMGSRLKNLKNSY